MSARTEEQLKNEILRETPDILGDLFASFDRPEGQEDLSCRTAMEGSGPVASRVPEEKAVKEKDVPEGDDRGGSLRRRIAFAALLTAAAAFLVISAAALQRAASRKAAQQEAPGDKAAAEFPEEAGSEKEDARNGFEEPAVHKEEAQNPSVTENVVGGAAVATVEIGPSVRITVDETQHVLACLAVDEDGEEILSGLELSGVDVHAASRSILESMRTKGYLGGGSAPVTVTVSAEDQAVGLALDKDLSSELNEFLADPSAVENGAGAGSDGDAGDGETIDGASSAAYEDLSGNGFVEGSAAENAGVTGENYGDGSSDAAGATPGEVSSRQIAGASADPAVSQGEGENLPAGGTPAP